MQLGRGRAWSWVVLALGATLLVAVPGSPAAAEDPTSCPFVPGPEADVFTWTGEGSTDRWGDPQNWSPPAFPNGPTDSNDGNGEPDRHETYVCISPAARNTVVVNGDAGNFHDHYFVQAFYLGAGAAIDIQRGASVTVENTAVESYAAPGSAITVTSGTLGGMGTIRSRGIVSVAATPLGGATLSSRAPTRSIPPTDGSPVVDSDGELRFPNLGVNVQRRYRIELRGTGRSVVSGTGAIGANYGTRFEIGPSAVLTLAGPGGYYQGFTDGFTTLSQLVNAGRLVKTGGGTSVIDADYTEVGAGEMVVEAGTVAFPDGTTFPARVQPGQRMSTERCAPTSGFQACAVETNPIVDPQAISLSVPSGDPGGAFVEVREHQVLGPAAEGKEPLTFDGSAHAEGLRVDPLRPAVIEMRFDERRAAGGMTDNLAVFQDGREIQTCLGTTGAPSLGQVACVDRRGRSDSTRKVGGNFYVVVRATTTSRWRVGRVAEDAAAPTLYMGSSQRSGKPWNPVRLTVKKCSERCSLVGTGHVKVPGLGKLRLQKTTKSARANRRAILKLRLTPAAARKLAGSNAGRGKAIVIVKARDRAGNFVRQKVTVKLR